MARQAIARTARHVAAAACALSAVSTLALGQVGTFEITDMGAGPFSAAYGVNNRNTVVGEMRPRTSFGCS